MWPAILAIAQGQSGQLKGMQPEEQDWDKTNGQKFYGGDQTVSQGFNALPGSSPGGGMGGGLQLGSNMGGQPQGMGGGLQLGQVLESLQKKPDLTNHEQEMDRANSDPAMGAEPDTLESSREPSGFEKFAQGAKAAASIAAGAKPPHMSVPNFGGNARMGGMPSISQQFAQAGQRPTMQHFLNRYRR